MPEFRTIFSKPLPIADEADRYARTATWLSTELSGQLSAATFDVNRFVATLDAYVDEKIKAALAAARKLRVVE